MEAGQGQQPGKCLKVEAPVEPTADRAPITLEIRANLGRPARRPEMSPAPCAHYQSMIQPSGPKTSSAVPGYGPPARTSGDRVPDRAERAAPGCRPGPAWSPRRLRPRNLPSSARPGAGAPSPVGRPPRRSDAPRGSGDVLRTRWGRRGRFREGREPAPESHGRARHSGRRSCPTRPGTKMMAVDPVPTSRM